MYDLIISGTEILNATKVSTSWETFIGSSQTCMRKIDLTINGRKYFLNHRENELKDDLKMLSASSRQYKNFTLYAQKPGFLTKDVMNLLMTRKWSKIKVWSEKFEDENEFERFLLSIMENVENLELRNISLVNATTGYESGQEFVFKRLKALILCNAASSDWLLKSLTNCHQLESIEVENVNGDALINFLQATPTVKMLRITESNLNDEFYSKLAILKSVKLEDFRIKTCSSKTSEKQIGLKKFLEMQADNIKSLTVDTPLTFDVMQTILKFPNLTSLNILTKPDYQLIGLTINRSIVDLTINFDCSYELILGLINSMANLKTVKIPTTLYMKVGFPIKEERKCLSQNDLFQIEMF